MAEFPFFEPERILRRNLAPNPSFEGGNAVWSAHNSSAVVDDSWSSVGAKSIKITPAGANRYSFIQAGTTTSLPFGMEAGKTYTVSATARLLEPQTGTMSIYARSILGTALGSGGEDLGSAIRSEPLPNAAGSGRLSATFTLPDETVGMELRLYNGAMNTADNSLWWDAIVVEEGVTGGGYFDGDQEAGTLLRTNLIPNPSAESGDAEGWSAVNLSLFSSTGYTRGGVVGDRQFIVIFEPSSTGTPYVVSQAVPVQQGKWFGVALNMGRSTGARFGRVSVGWTLGGSHVSFDNGPVVSLRSASLETFSHVAQVPEGVDGARIYIHPMGDLAGGTPPAGRTLIDAVLAVSTDSPADTWEAIGGYFDGDTESDTDDLRYAWLGATRESPSGEFLVTPSAETRWLGTPHSSPSELYVPEKNVDQLTGVTEAGVATVDRRGLVSETFARSREKIDLQLAEPDERLKGGERIELAAFAASSSEVTWRWRQVTGPEVFLVREGNTCYFQAPDVDNLTDMRIAVSASSVDGANRSDWHYFDLEIRPTVGRFAAEGSDGFLPYTPQMVGYNRGKREIWNDVIAPVGMDPEGRKEPKLVDLGIPADDVTFALDGEEPARASAGAVYVDIQDGAIYRNFGGGYNETDDTTGAPRLNAYMVNPATGEVFEWMESEHPRGTWGSAFYRWTDANYDWRGLK